MNNIYLYIIICIVLGLCMPKVKWHLDIGVMNGEWKIPSWLEKDDYTPLSVLQEVANEVINNNNRLQEMRDRLEANSSADNWARVVMSVILMGATILGMLLKIKKIKKGVTAVSGMATGGQAMMQPMQPMRPGPGPGYPSSFWEMGLLNFKCQWWQSLWMWWLKKSSCLVLSCVNVKI